MLNVLWDSDDEERKRERKGERVMRRKGEKRKERS